MMASMIGAGASLLLAAAAIPSHGTNQDVDAATLRQVHMAAASAASEDARAYLEQERRTMRVQVASVDRGDLPRPAPRR